MAGRVVIEPSARHTATIIFLHGLGDTGHGWVDAMKSIRPAFAKVICPTAATMPVTLNGGFRMPSWFDLRSLDDKKAEDAAGIKSARDAVHALLDEQVSDGVPASRIVLGGFSQGGALALYSAFTYRQRLAGVMALSCWLPLRDEFPSEAVGTGGAASAGSNDTPVLQCHGDCDPLVQYKWGQLTSQHVRKFAANVEFKTYHGLMHSSSEQELDDMKHFVQKVLAQNQ